jgi:hypothetical protein
LCWGRLTPNLVDSDSAVGYRDFNNLMGFTSKKLPCIFLKNKFKKFILKEEAGFHSKIEKILCCLFHEPEHFFIFVKKRRILR